MYKKIALIVILVILAFIAYVFTYYKSGINTLRTNSNVESIDYRIITDDLSERQNYFTWVGQATILLNLENTNILFDPIFSDRASPFKSIGPKRNTPPVLTTDKLPPIDLIFISHNHYDHLDLDSLAEIQSNNPDVQIYVPKGDRQLLINSGLNNIKELNWWQTTMSYGLEIFFVPTKHWSARGLFDRKKSLWGGWAIKSQNKTILHIGDTAYADYFKEFPQKLGQIDLTFMPIGSYYPRDIEAEYHVDPYEAIQLTRDLGSLHTYGIHWGGVFFTQEPTYEPQKIINEAMLLDPNLNFSTSLPGIIFDIP